MNRTDEKAIIMYINLVHDIHKYREERHALKLHRKAGADDFNSKFWVNRCNTMIDTKEAQCSVLEHLYDVNFADAIIFDAEFCDDSYEKNFKLVRRMFNLDYDD